jgi:hypothetical protein
LLNKVFTSLGTHRVWPCPVIVWILKVSANKGMAGSITINHRNRSSSNWDDHEIASNVGVSCSYVGLSPSEFRISPIQDCARGWEFPPMFFLRGYPSLHLLPNAPSLCLNNESYRRACSQMRKRGLDGRDQTLTRPGNGSRKA